MLCCPQLPVTPSTYHYIHTTVMTSKLKPGYMWDPPACRVLEEEQQQAELGSNGEHLYHRTF